MKSSCCSSENQKKISYQFYFPTFEAYKNVKISLRVVYSTAEDGRLGIEGYVSTELLISISIPHMVILHVQRKKTLWKK